MLPREHYLKQAFNGLRDLPAEALEELTDAQVRLIKKHGVLIRALLDDEVLNPNLTDLRLVKTLTLKNAPTNPVEQAWMKYEMLLACQKQARPRLKKSA